VPCGTFVDVNVAISEHVLIRGFYADEFGEEPEDEYERRTRG